MPKPLQKPGVPIWISGTLHKNVINRIIHYGDGWIPWGKECLNLAASISTLRTVLKAKAPGKLNLHVAGPLPFYKDRFGDFDLDRSLRAVPQQVEAGITDFRIIQPIPWNTGESLEILKEIVSGFRATVKGVT
jgi:hypothetical protein